VLALEMTSILFFWASAKVAVFFIATKIYLIEFEGSPKVGKVRKLENYFESGLLKTFPNVQTLLTCGLFGLS
jgi:hypothetical protein